MRILYQFPLSHFCEKARWLLDHKELDFVAQNVVPGVHRAFAQLKTGQNKLPILSLLFCHRFCIFYPSKTDRCVTT